MTNDLIGREDLKKALDELFKSGGYDSGLVMNIIDNAPTVPLPDFKAGYKQGYEDAKKEFESKIITQAIREELEALSKEIDGDMLLMLSMFGAGVRVNILGKLRERSEEE